MDIEQRLMIIEERVRDVSQKQTTHDAVCIERQKTMFNTLSSIETQVGSLDARVALLGTDMRKRTISARQPARGWIVG